MLKSLFGCFLLLASSCLAQSSNASTSATGTLEPCGQVSSLLASYTAASPSATLLLPIDVQLAQDCYDSVALNQDDATSLIDGLTGMLEFQSDLEYLIKPPSGYLLAGVDLQKELNDLRGQVTSNKITGEIDFETRVAKILAQAHDGHLAFRIDGLSIFSLSRPTGSLVSVSMNGTDTPKMYRYSEVVDYANGTGQAPTAISQVNGMDVTDFILQQAQNSTYGQLQDPDALFNSFMWSWNDQAGVGNSLGAFIGFPQEPLDLFTNFTFENGTSVSISNQVLTTEDFSSVVDGDSFYQSFINVSATTDTSAAGTATVIPTSTATETAPAATATSIMGYPTPAVISSDGAFSGYFLDSAGFEDTAVLALRFMTEAAAESFQRSLTQFLDACRAQNKQYLVIDVTGNPGGTVALAYDLIKQLFPSIEPWGTSNYRAHEGFRRLGQFITNASTEAQQDNPGNYTAFINAGGTSDYDADSHLDVNNNPFQDFVSYYGPRSAAGGYGNYTNLTRMDLNNVDYNEATSNIVVSGYGNMTNVAAQPFENTKVILLSDGQCSSTCTIFSHFLKYQAKVKAIALGGRPRTGPMQNIGGIKGSEVQPFATLNGVVNFVASNIDDSELSSWNGTTLGAIYNNGDYLVQRTASGGSKSAELSFNVRNNIAEGDTSITPLQFIYEAADCRLFYQPKHYLEITNIWTDVASQAFGLNGTPIFSSCVDGSTDQPSSLSGDPDLYADGKLQNGTSVDIGPGISNQTSNDGQQNGTSETQRVSFVIIAWIVLLNIGISM